MCVYVIYDAFIFCTVNKTELACPVDVSDKYQVCGTDNRTYESLCRMILETDGVDVLFDGPCNQSDCKSTVSDNYRYAHVQMYW